MAVLEPARVWRRFLPARIHAYELRDTRLGTPDALFPAAFTVSYWWTFNRWLVDLATGRSWFCAETLQYERSAHDGSNRSNQLSG
jgi:hypothetical protein